MKRFAATLLFLFLSLCLTAQSRGLLVSQQWANRFFEESAARKDRPVLLGTFDACTVWGYDDKGFVMISSSEKLPVVLGYSLDNPFDPNRVAPQLRAWLKEIADNVEKLPPDYVYPSALPATKASTSHEVLLETALWDQGDPYNRKCPTGTPTGCTNTATAIVMRYYEWPAAGEGVLLDYPYIRNNGESVTQQGHALGHRYDWGSMPLSYVRGEYSDYSGEQVAQLMYDVGIMNETEYNPEGSGAWLDEVRLQTFMRYDPGIRFIERERYSDFDWEALIKNELESGRPILYCGWTEETEEVGHYWVLDGYRTGSEDNVYHMNWGWGGFSNGFYIINPVNHYPLYNNMVIGISPDRKRALSLKEFSASNNEVSGSFHVNAKIKNYAGRKDSYNLKIVHTNKAGGTKETLWTGSLNIEPGETGDLSVDCVATMPVKEGDLLSVMFQFDNSWYIIDGQSLSLYSLIKDHYTLSFNKEEGLLTVTTYGVVPVLYRYSQAGGWMSATSPFTVSRDEVRQKGGTVYIKIDSDKGSAEFPVRF